MKQFWKDKDYNRWVIQTTLEDNRTDDEILEDLKKCEEKLKKGHRDRAIRVIRNIDNNKVYIVLSNRIEQVEEGWEWRHYVVEALNLQDAMSIAKFYDRNINEIGRDKKQELQLFEAMTMQEEAKKELEEIQNGKETSSRENR